MNETYAVSVVELAPMTVAASATVVANLAWQHMRSAVLHRDYARREEMWHAGEEFSSFFEVIRCHVISSVLSAAAAIETLANELFLSPHAGLRCQMPNFEDDFWGTATAKGIESLYPLKKYRRALSLLGLPAMKNAQFDHVEHLISLRNFLIHYKPNWDPDRPQKASLVAGLNGRYSTSPFLNGNADFVSMQSMSASCAGWAVQSGATFIHKFGAASKLQPEVVEQIWRLA